MTSRARKQLSGDLTPRFPQSSPSTINNNRKLALLLPGSGVLACSTHQPVSQNNVGGNQGLESGSEEMGPREEGLAEGRKALARAQSRPTEPAGWPAGQPPVSCQVGPPVILPRRGSAAG